jgi:adenylate kinase family enzyme
MMQRIIVVGTSGSGKSTLARELSRRLDLPHIEMDALYWGPDWTVAEKDVFAARVRQAVAQDRWTLCGNYRAVSGIVFPRADTIVWLDYPMSLVFMRSLRRTIRRVITREPLWHGNRESFTKSFLSKDSILLWVIQTWRRRRRDYPRVLKGPMCRHMKVVRLRSPREADAWLEEVTSAGPSRDRRDN